MLMKTLEFNIGAPSSFGREWPKVQERMSKDDVALNCHRPPENYGNHVSLYYKGFDTFVSECNEVTLNKDDCMFALSFCWDMAQSYQTEKDRMLMVRNKLGYYFEDNYDIRCINNMDGAIFVKSSPIMIVEGKNEVGSGGCDSFMEAVAYYHKNADREIILTSNAPCFIVEIVCPQLAIAGAVLSDSILVDRLIPSLWCVPQPYDRGTMIRIARCLKSLKNAIRQPKQDCQKQLKQPRFPFFTWDGNMEYVQEIKHNLFLCKLKAEKEKVVVKFVEEYAIIVHEFMAARGYAPSIKKYEKVTSRYHALVMEYIESGVPLTVYDLKDSEKEHLKNELVKIVEEMHGGGFCHGDLRSNNILVLPPSESQRLMVVDFDWAGKIDEQRYPYFMNHAEIEWPPNASDNEKILREHDLYWVEKKLFVISDRILF